MNLLIKIVATGFGAGYAPFLPGTFGSLWGVVLFYFIGHFPFTVLLLTAVFLYFAATFIAHRAEIIFQSKDCQKIVIDEIAGQFVAFLFVPFSYKNLVFGFLLFRLFDIIKIFPVKWAEEKLPGGLGVATDDLIAGFQAGIVLYILLNYG